MEFTHYDALYEISNVKSEIQGKEIIIKWHWPETINAVYICRARTLDGIKDEDLASEKMKLCTKSQYQSRGYYSEIINDREEFIYRLYPAVRKEGKWFLVNQDNKNNETIICTGKINVNIKITESTVPFSDLKRVEITLYSEAHISKDDFGYTIKNGGYPHNAEDGFIYDFVKDIGTSEISMPEIIIPKNWYVRVFFSNTIASRRYNLNSM